MKRQSEDEQTEYIVQANKAKMEQTQDLDMSFGKGDWNSVSKDGTTEIRGVRIQGDYLSESETSKDLDYLQTEKDGTVVQKKGPRH